MKDYQERAEVLFVLLTNATDMECKDDNLATDILRVSMENQNKRDLIVDNISSQLDILAYQMDVMPSDDTVQKLEFYKETIDKIGDLIG